MFLLLSGYLISVSFNGKYPQLWGLVLGAACGFFGLYAVYTILLELEIISSRTTHPAIPPKTEFSGRYAWVWLILTLLASYIAFRYYTRNDDGVAESDLTALTDILTSEVKIVSGPKGAKSIDIRLKKHPGFDFEIDGLAFQATHSDNFINQVKTGDTVSIDILTDDYEKKIAGRKPLTFWDKTVNYGFIPVYGLRHRGTGYLNVEEYNRASREDPPWAWGFILFIVVGLYFFRTRKRWPLRRA